MPEVEIHATLVERLRARESAAYREVFDLYSPRVLATALRHVPANDPTEAYDIVQEVFLKFFKLVETLPVDREFSLGSYLNTITRSVCRHYMLRQYGRKRRVVSLKQVLDLPDPTPGPDEGIDAERIVYKALAAVSERDRLLVQMRLNDSSFGEIAETLGISEASARTRYFRAVTSVRQMLERARGTETE